ncbi:hypothetical protein N0V88_003885 [Collariella sp. IMI 366227]|nr:hypothetical protein N0V88_003885 [Collariella sp. IMI 366227]
MTLKLAYLDGLRGIAALLVFICHYTENNFSSSPLLRPQPHGKPLLLPPTPLLRLIYSGRPMVHIFFIISGFALSLRPLQHLHARDREGATRRWRRPRFDGR